MHDIYNVQTEDDLIFTKVWREMIIQATAFKLL